MIDYYNYLDKLLDNIVLTQYGYTYEGKPLVYLMISSKKNMANIDNIKKSISMLADPRTLDDAKTANKIINRHQLLHGWHMLYMEMRYLALMQLYN